MIEKNFFNFFLYFKAFKEKSELKSGRDLWIQQIKCLLFKRFLVFRRRYILGAMILVLPILFQFLLTLIIPASSAVVDEVGQTVKNNGIMKLDVLNYGPQEILYKLNTSSMQLIQLFDKFYTYENRPKMNSVQPISPIADYIDVKQKSNINALIKGTYFGIDWNAPNSDVNKFEITAYYNKMAYHTQGAVVNEVRKFKFFFFANYLTI